MPRKAAQSERGIHLMPELPVMPFCECGCGGRVAPWVPEALELREQGLSWAAIASIVCVAQGSIATYARRYVTDPPRFITGHHVRLPEYSAWRDPSRRTYERTRRLPPIEVTTSYEAEVKHSGPPPIRICAECETVLSRYNTTDLCAFHERRKALADAS